jgi:hypothetical protein
MRAARAAALVVAAALLGAAGRLASQQGDSAAAARARFWTRARPVASLLVPGSGQLLGREDRGTVYLAAELYVLARYFQFHNAGNAGARRFRDLAFHVARRNFAPTPRDTVFEYYETMERFTASGQFDRDPGPAFAPEDDPATYNGSVWLLARRTFWADPDTPPPPTAPEYQRALAFYSERAVGPGYLWSWQDAALERQEFRSTIRGSDDAYRQAQTQLGLLLANHLVSAVDALISSRLAAVARRPAQLQTSLGNGWAAVHVTIAF